MKEKVGKRIQEARTRAGITQEALAEQLNVSTSAISRLETGHSMVSLERLYEISQLLHVGIQDLLCDLHMVTPENAAVNEELNYHISLMNQTQKKFLLEYIKLCENYRD